MAITHKKNDELEKLLSGFASIPNFDKPITSDGSCNMLKNEAKEESQND